MTPRLLLLAALAVVVGGCSDAFDPTVDDDRVFAIDGMLDGTMPRQVVRVQDISAPIATPLDQPAAAVTSTEIQSGVVTAWRDSVVTLDDGGADRVYLADLSILAGDIHRIDAVRADGASSSVTVTIPDPVAVVTASTSAPSFAVRYSIDGLRAEAIAPVVRYRVRRGDGTGERELVQAIAFDQTGPSASFFALLGSIEAQARTALYGFGAGDVVLLDLRLDTVLESEAPAPVERGVGGVGWRAPISITLPADTALLTQAGFVDGRE